MVDTVTACDGVSAERMGGSTASGCMSPDLDFGVCVLQHGSWEAYSIPMGAVAYSIPMGAVAYSIPIGADPHGSWEAYSIACELGGI